MFYKVYLDEIAVKQESWQLHRYIVIFLSTLHQLSACLIVCSKKISYSVVLLVYIRCKYFKLIGIYIVVGLAWYLVFIFCRLDDMYKKLTEKKSLIYFTKYFLLFRSAANTFIHIFIWKHIFSNSIQVLKEKKTTK